MPTNLTSVNEPLSHVSSLQVSRRPSSLQRRKSRIAGVKILYIPFLERLFIGLAVVVQVIILALLIASATTDVFEVDGTRAISVGMNLTNISTALGVDIAAGTKPFCYSLWGARRCRTSNFHTESWYLARDIPYKGYPVSAAQTMMLGSAAFTTLAACYSFINIIGIVVVVILQDYTAVLCAWSFSVWITILIAWALTVGVYAQPIKTLTNAATGKYMHVKDYSSFTASFALMMAAFGLHTFQFTFTVVYERLFESRMKSIVKEQKQLNVEQPPQEDLE